MEFNPRFYSVFDPQYSQSVSATSLIDESSFFFKQNTEEKRTGQLDRLEAYPSEIKSSSISHLLQNDQPLKRSFDNLPFDKWEEKDKKYFIENMITYYPDWSRIQASMTFSLSISKCQQVWKTIVSQIQQDFIHLGKIKNLSFESQFLIHTLVNKYRKLNTGNNIHYITTNLSALIEMKISTQFFEAAFQFFPQEQVPAFQIPQVKQLIQRSEQLSSSKIDSIYAFSLKNWSFNKKQRFIHLILKYESNWQHIAIEFGNFFHAKEYQAIWTNAINEGFIVYEKKQMWFPIIYLIFLHVQEFVYQTSDRTDYWHKVAKKMCLLLNKNISAKICQERNKIFIKKVLEITEKSFIKVK